MRRIAMLMLGLTTLSTACVLAPPLYWAESISGRVVDADSGEPIEGAVVVADWLLYSGGMGHGGVRDSLFAEEALTNGNGEFRFGKWGPKRRPAYQYLGYAPFLVVFKAGYRHQAMSNQASSNGFVRSSAWSGQDIRLTKFDGDAEQRLNSLDLILSISAQRPSMLREILVEQNRYTVWPPGGRTFFTHVANLLAKRDSNATNAR